VEARAEGHRLTDLAAPEWFRRAFGEIYPLVYPHRDDDSAARETAQLVDVLALDGGGALVLDLACGTGRHTVAFARAGLRVVGLDLSEPLAHRAYERAELTGRVVLGDMRALPFDSAFSLVANLFTSFGYFQGDAENAHVLSEMARVLVPGGRVVIDHVNRTRLEATLVPCDTRVGEGYRMKQRRRICGNRVIKDVVVSQDDGTVTEFREDVRLYTPDELACELMAAGFSELRFYGWYDGAPLTEQSERMIAVARKPLRNDK
jgi:SAM-dependent methyltransferase